LDRLEVLRAAVVPLVSRSRKKETGMQGMEGILSETWRELALRVGFQEGRPGNRASAGARPALLESPAPLAQEPPAGGPPEEPATDDRPNASRSSSFIPSIPCIPV